MSSRCVPSPKIASRSTQYFSRRTKWQKRLAKKNLSRWFCGDIQWAEVRSACQERQCASAAASCGSPVFLGATSLAATFPTHYLYTVPHRASYSISQNKPSSLHPLTCSSLHDHVPPVRYPQHSALFLCPPLPSFITFVNTTVRGPMEGACRFVRQRCKMFLAGWLNRNY